MVAAADHSREHCAKRDQPPARRQINQVATEGLAYGGRWFSVQHTTQKNGLTIQITQTPRATAPTRLVSMLMPSIPLALSLCIMHTLQ